jgi:hypothetical protein
MHPAQFSLLTALISIIVCKPNQAIVVNMIYYEHTCMEYGQELDEKTKQGNHQDSCFFKSKTF